MDVQHPQELITSENELAESNDNEGSNVHQSLEFNKDVSSDKNDLSKVGDLNDLKTPNLFSN